MRRSVLFVTLVALVVDPSGVRADPNPSDMALAEALFRRGRELVDAHDYAQACPKLGESYHLDPKLGTLLNFAMCLESDGKTASAWGAFHEAVQLAHRAAQSDREKFAQNHVRSLDAKLSRVTVVVDDLLPGEQIELDGRAMGPGLIGAPLPLDPGEHRLEAWSSGKIRWESKFTLTKGPSQQTLHVPALKDVPVMPLSSATPTPSVVPSAVTTPSSTASQPWVDEKASRSGAKRRTLSYVMGGVGLVSLGVGAVFGAKALSSKSVRDEHCPQHACDSTGASASSDGRTQGNIATVGLAAGAVVLGAGALLYFTSGSAPSQPANLDSSLARAKIRPTVAPGHASLDLEYSW